jgi:hypothetical protein
MPFRTFLPRSFTHRSICTHAPQASGVYGISNAQGWIYIGESDDIRGSLLAHLQQTESSLSDLQPSGFVFELCDFGRATRQDRLVAEYGPSCNRIGNGTGQERTRDI